MMQPTSMPSVHFVPSTYPITETSILGRRGQELCADAATYWAWPSYTTDMKDVDTSSMTITSPMANVSRKRRQVANIPWCWALQCQTIAIGSYYNQLRTFICCNRQYRCPCSSAPNVISSLMATTTPAMANAIVANYGAQQSPITS